MIGFDVNINFSGEQAIGRLGGEVFGMDVTGSAISVEPIIAEHCMLLPIIYTK